MKKVLSLILSILMAFSLPTFAGAADASNAVSSESRLYSDSAENIFSTPEETYLYLNIINNDSERRRYTLSSTVTRDETGEVVWTGTQTTLWASADGGNRKATISPQNITEFGDYTLDVVVSVQGAPEGTPTFPFSTTFSYVPQGIISTAYAGNIFPSNQNVAVNFDLTNTSQNPHTFAVQYEITDEKGRIIKNEKESLYLAAGAKHEKVFASPTDRFGIYTLKATVTDDSGRIYSYDKEFSIVNAPKNMPRKKSIGMVSRMVSLGTSGPDVDASMQILDNLGVGTISDGVRWYEYEQSKGVYGLSDTKKARLEKEITYANENGVELILCFHGDNPDIYNTSDKIPRDEEALLALKAAAQSFAAEYKGKVSTFSFTNEPDLSRRQDVLSCEDFAEALRYYSEGIKAGNPDAKVIGVNVSQVNTEWIEKLIKAGAGEYIDGVAIHPYQGPGSPESFKWVEMTSTVREMLTKHGYGHLKVYGTEGNSPESKAYNTELQQGFNLVRTYALMEATNCIDMFKPHQLYSLLQSGDDENGYGIIEPWADPKNPCAAKPAYLQACNFSALTADKEHKKLIEEDGVYIHHYESSSGEDVLMMYADMAVKKVSLKINASNGKMYDAYGNSDEVSALGGEYTFILSDTPTYFLGDFSSFSICEGSVGVGNVLFELPKGSRGEAEISLDSLSDYTITLEAPDEISASVTRSGDSATVSIAVNDIPAGYDFTAKRQMYGTMEYRDYVNILIKKGDTLYAKLPVAVNYLHKSVDAQMYIRPNTTDSSTKWEGVITIRNNKPHDSISGTVKIERPSSLSSVSFTFDSLSPSASQSFRFDISDSLAAGYLWCVAELTLSDGEVIEFQLGGHPRSYYYSSGQWTRVQPFQALNHSSDFTIDGNISSGEWDDFLLTSFDESVENPTTTPDDEQRPDDTGDSDSEDYESTVLTDFSGDIYGAWDEQFLYVAMKVNDSIHNQHEVPAQMSRSDSIAVTTMNSTLQSHNSKYSIALTDYSGERQSVLTTNWASVFGQPYKGVIKEGTDGAKVKVTRNESDGITIYEARVPWKRLLGRNAVKNDNLKLSLSANDYDTTGVASKSYSLTRWTCLVREDEAPMTIVDGSGDAVKSVGELRTGDAITFKASPQEYNGNYNLYLAQFYENKLITTQLARGKGTGLAYESFNNLVDGTVTVEGNNVTISTTVSNRRRLATKADENGNKYMYYETEGYDTVGVSSKPGYAVKFTDDITEGIAVISFDIGRGDTDGGAFVDSNGSSTDDFLHMRDNDDTRANQRGFFYASSGSGYMCSGKDDSRNMDTTVTASYEKNKIYHVDVVFDRDNNRQYTFIDGQLLNDMPYEKAMNASSFQFFISWSVGYFDNLCVKQFASTGKSTLSYEDIRRDSLSTTVAGNIDEIRAFVFENKTLAPVMESFVLN